MTAYSPSVVRAFRVVTASLVAVRLLLLQRHLQFAAMQVAAPVDDVFFPTILRHPFLLLTAAIIPLLTGAFALIKPTRTAMRWHAAIEALAAGTLLVHQATYFFATWVVAFWAGAFLVWLAWSGTRSETMAREKGPFLAQLIIAFLFLGGAVGKWTAAYWSGEPFFDLLFSSHPSFLFSELRQRFDEPTLRMIATGYSRSIVAIETGMAFIVFLPARPAAILGVVAGLGLWSASGDLYEVTLPIIGLACAAWLLAGQEHSDTAVAPNQPTRELP